MGAWAWKLEAIIKTLNTFDSRKVINKDLNRDWRSNEMSTDRFVKIH